MKRIILLTILSLSCFLGIGQFSGKGPVTLSTPSTATNIQWFKDGVAISGQNSTTFSTSTVGTYFASYTDVTTACRTYNFVLILSGNSVTLDGLTNNGGGTAYQWYSGVTAIPGANTSTFTTSTGGIYHLEYDNGTCVVKSDFYYVFLLISPEAPLLTVESPECNGNTYSVRFASNGTVTASAGTVTGNIVTGIPIGTNVVLTSTSADGAITRATVNSPTDCNTIGCTTPTLSAGQGVCEGIGSGTYSVAFNASAGAVISANAGTVSGNMITGIPTGTNVSITAKSATGNCSTSVTVTSPTDCISPCTTPGVSFSAGICHGDTYSVSISNPGNAAISVSPSNVGIVVSATDISQIPIGTSVSVTVTAAGCVPKIIILNSPPVIAPLLTTQSPVCNGSTYSVVFYSSGVVTASAGTITGNMITGIPISVSVIISATATNGCGFNTTRVNAPTSCARVGCVAPALSAGQGTCTGTGTYTVAFNASADATISTTAGTVSGGTIVNIPITSDVTITATSATGSCSNSITVTRPSDCSTACVTPGASFSAGICQGAGKYSINVSNPNNVTITISPSAGITQTATSISNIPLGTNMSLTVTAPNCSPQTITIISPSATAPALVVDAPVCDGSTYHATFTSDGAVTVTSGTGTISGNSVINIPAGTSVTLTSVQTNGCSNTVVIINSPVGCGNPIGPIFCVIPCSAPGALTPGEMATTVAAGSNVTSTASGGIGGTVTWAITPTTGVSVVAGSGNSTGSIKFSSTGIFTVKFTSSKNGTPTGCNQAGTTTTTRTITVN